MKSAFILAAILLFVCPRPSGAVGTFILNETDTLSAAGSITETLTVQTFGGLTFGSVTIGTVALALDISEFKPSAQSPHHNVVTMTLVANTVGVTNNGGITTVQQTAGGANVTMSLNNIVVGVGHLAGTAPLGTFGTNINPTLFLVGVLNQPFTVKNSYWFAQVLNKQLLVEAAVSLAGTAGVIESILSVGLSEFSPHHNLGIGREGINFGSVNSNFGIVTVQQTAGFANVTESLNTLIVGSAVISGAGSIAIGP